MVDIYNQFKDFKSFEVIFSNENKELQKIYCTVKAIENNRIVLLANNQKNKNALARVGDVLQLNIYTDNGIYSANSKVLLATKGLINIEYVITYPANSKHSQRREYFRADIPVKFAMTIFTDGSATDDMVIEATTRNICGKGMSYISSRPFVPYKTIEIELLFEERTIRTTAELVYTKSTFINEKPKFIHAFTFVDITPQNIEFIVKKCFLHQLNLRKSN